MVAIAGAPRSDRGVRVLQVRDLAKDMADRSHVLPRLRAQRAARELGMRLDGDERRIFIGGEPGAVRRELAVTRTIVDRNAPEAPSFGSDSVRNGHVGVSLANPG